LITSSSKTADAKVRAKTEQTIGNLEGAIAKIDPGKLEHDDAQRHALALDLLKSAQKAFSERDYIAADSLATKACVLLAPLTTGRDVPNPAGH
jgi:hypothetical protein